MRAVDMVELEYTPIGRCAKYYMSHKNATAEELELNCDVSGGFAEAFLASVREAPAPQGPSSSTLSQQVGGSHYKDMAVQPWVALEAWLTPEEYRGYHKGVAISYLAREKQKGETQDIKKAIHHLSRLVEMSEQDKP